jgi:hypothetical protein
MPITRLAFILAAPLILAACLLTPGRFTSTLDIKRDRAFTFTYAGEVIAVEEKADETCKNEAGEECSPAQDAAAKAKRLGEQEVKLREIAVALEKEAGYRSVRYLGERKFQVDYAVSGRLDRNFTYPFNSDASAVFPWIAIELRKDGTVRMKAPAFGDGNESGGLSGPFNPMEQAAAQRQGSFTLTTDAEIVMQNEESGIAAAPGSEKRIVWRVTPATKTVPTAVLRFAN